MRLSLIPFQLAALALLSACATSQPAAVAIPDAIKAPAGEKVAMIVPAKGVQVYECRAKQGQAGAFEWGFVAPDANLYDAQGNVIGHHYAGPVWESNDGSKVTAKVAASAPAPQAGAVAWLLLTTTASGPNGAFSKVTSIQRVNTAGGVAPKDGCGAASVGHKARVAYTTDYYLLTKS